MAGQGGQAWVELFIHETGAVDSSSLKCINLLTDQAGAMLPISSFIPLFKYLSHATAWVYPPYSRGRREGLEPNYLCRSCPKVMMKAKGGRTLRSRRTREKYFGYLQIDQILR